MFKVGDRVRVVVDPLRNPEDGPVDGWKGTIKYKYLYSPIWAVEFDIVSTKLQASNFLWGCDGRVPSRNGRYMPEYALRKVEYETPLEEEIGAYICANLSG